MIELLAWDSQMLGVKVGKLVGEMEGADFDDYDLIVARKLQQEHASIVKLEQQGFRYVGLDVALLRSGLVPPPVFVPTALGWQIKQCRRSLPEFSIAGFRIDDSRFMLDDRCRECLPADFWDQVIGDHCQEFADVVVCATDERQRLGAFISCLHKQQSLDMFLVATHPDCQNRGLGTRLVYEVVNLAEQLQLPVTTSVMASNVRAFNFYLQHQFTVASAEVILHRWRTGTNYEQ